MGGISLRKAWADHSQWLVDKEIERSSSFSSSETNAWCHPWPRVPPWDQAETTSLFSFFPCYTLGFPDSSVGKESTRNAGDLDSIPWSGRSHGEGVDYPHQYSWASLVAQLLKNPPEMQETWVRSLGWEYPLGKGKATHSIIFWPGEFHRLNSPWGHKELDTTE